MFKKVSVTINPVGNICMFCKAHSFHTDLSAYCHAYNEHLDVKKDDKGSYKVIIFRCKKYLEENISEGVKS